MIPASVFRSRALQVAGTAAPPLAACRPLAARSRSWRTRRARSSAENGLPRKAASASSSGAALSSAA